MEYPKPKKENGRFVCPICNKDFGYRSGYRRHYRKVHDIKGKNPKTHIEQIEEKDAPREEKLEEMYEAVREFNKSLQSLENSKKNIKFKVSGDFIAVSIVSDLHYGNVNVDMDYVERVLSFIENNERAYCVLNGDILDNWTVISPQGGVYEQTLNPEYQKEIMVHKLKPLKDKILAIIYGN